MLYPLHNGGQVTVRRPEISDAQAIIHVIATADTQTRFLAREPGEFSVTVEQEQKMISQMAEEADSAWFLAEYEGNVVGQCSVGLVRKNKRFRHRAEMAIVLLQEYWGLGIGSRLMETCIGWCREKGVSQLELMVVADNHRALKLYQSFGFEITGTIPNALSYQDGSFADEYYMVKKL